MAVSKNYIILFFILPAFSSSLLIHEKPSCEDLMGIGSLNTTCQLRYSLNSTRDVNITGGGNLVILHGVSLACVDLGCEIAINMMGEFRLNPFAKIVAGSVLIVAANATFFENSIINATGRAGDPPESSTGTPGRGDGGGGGHGGRGACCNVDDSKRPDDVWGGDSYSWDTLDAPISFGSKGGTTNKDDDYGGLGGGKIRLEVKDKADMRGMFLAEGGNGGIKGGGGSGGSIYVKSSKMTGDGKVSACGGDGFGGGGGGRVSVEVVSMHDDPIFLVHGGRSFGCPTNAGAAGTFFDAVPRRLIINNHNMSTNTDTLLLQFPNQPLWTNVYVQNRARAIVPLLWSRVQVRGQISLSRGAYLSFGLLEFAYSEFELMAEELLMSDSTIKVYGALRMSVKIHLMLNSTVHIDGDGDPIVATSMLEVSNLIVLKGSSVIRSTSNLGLHGQGLLNLTGPGDLIEAQRLVLSLFYAISVGPGSVLRGPLENKSDGYKAPKLYCEQKHCPVELLYPPEDCNVNASLPFTLQICRVEDISVEGFVGGSVVHFHWVRSVVVKALGVISASGLGCTGGLGQGEILPNGLSSGAGHGGRGGDAYYEGVYIRGGDTYGNAKLPCQLGSGSGNQSLPGATSGGGIIIMGSLEHSLAKLEVHGKLKADGGNYSNFAEEHEDGLVRHVSPGGGSGGTILLFVHYLELDGGAAMSTSGGYGSPNGGGGGGGRIYFHWSDISIGDEYLPMATIQGTIDIRGGVGKGLGREGKNGTVSGKACPEGLFGVFCQECPTGTYKNETGSDRMLCHDCPSHELPHRASYISVRGGVMSTPCPYTCLTDRYHMPRCYTALEELVYTFGGPWLFGFLLSSILIILALILSAARMKFACGDDLPGLVPNRRGSLNDRSFPFLESLNEVLETSRTEESQTHVHRMYFLGANTFSEPLHLPHSPPKEVKEIVYEDAFNRFVDETNALASYQWWEGSVHGILCLIAYPLAWSWLQWRRKNKVQRLREFVRSEYDHACLRSCRSRALYEGLKVSATSDLMLAHVDFFLGGDEKRDGLPPSLHQRMPMSLVFGGNGTYMAPFCLHSDNILTNIMSQSVPPTIWYRLVAGLNAQLRLVRRGHLRATFNPVINWLETHANPTLRSHGVFICLTRFQPLANGHCQFGVVVCSIEYEHILLSFQELSKSLLSEKQSRLPINRWKKALGLVRGEHVTLPKKIPGDILNSNNIEKLQETFALDFPLYYVIRNIRPVSHRDLVGLIISVLLLGDFSLVLLLLLQLYSISLFHVFLVLSVLPLGILVPFPAGINALFSHGPTRSAALARVYAMWNVASMINVIVAFICGVVHFKIQSLPNTLPTTLHTWNFTMDESGWWTLPMGLIICKILQLRLVDHHVANLEIQDRTLYSSERNVFWQ